jgi:hypothetical protein
MWAYYLQVPEGALSSVLVDDQERQQSSSVPFGKVHAANDWMSSAYSGYALTLPDV